MAAPITSVRAFLEQNGLGEHAATFEKEEIALDQLSSLTTDDLKELGLSMGARKKFEAGVANLNAAASGAGNAEESHQPKTVVGGAISGVGAVAGGLYDGVTGLVTKPVQGAQEGGVTGFLGGVVGGVAGAVTSTVGGVVDGGTKLAQGTINTPGAIKDAVTGSGEKQADE